MNAFNTNVRVYCRRLNIEDLATFFIDNEESRSAITKLSKRFGYDLTNKDHLGRTAAFTVALIIKLKAMQEDTPKDESMLSKEECTNAASIAINIFHAINNVFNGEGSERNIKLAGITFGGEMLGKGVRYSDKVFDIAEKLVNTYFTNRRNDKSSVVAVVLNQSRNENGWDA